MWKLISINPEKFYKKRYDMMVKLRVKSLVYHNMFDVLGKL